jgi:hypothetical protein
MHLSEAMPGSKDASPHHRSHGRNAGFREPGARRLQTDRLKCLARCWKGLQRGRREPVLLVPGHSADRIAAPRFDGRQDRPAADGARDFGACRGATGR